MSPSTMTPDRALICQTRRRDRAAACHAGWLAAVATALVLVPLMLLAGPAAQAEPGAATYTMTPDDLKLDCPKLTGRIRLRIRQLRGALADGQTTAVARGLQQLANPVFGGATRGMNPDAEVARDRAILTAYNQRLAEKACPTFDLAKDLAPGSTAEPRPVKRTAAPAAPKPAAAAPKPDPAAPKPAASAPKPAPASSGPPATAAPPVAGPAAVR